MLSPRPQNRTALSILSGLLTLAIVFVLALGIVEQGEINAQSITGAVCIYIVLGMVFLFVYGAAAAYGHAPFFLQGTDGTRALRLYFSYVTLATLGYGTIPGARIAAAISA